MAPHLKNFYTKLHEQGHPVEIVFVSLDRDEQQMLNYYTNEQGDWMAIKYDAPARQELTKEYQIRGIPSLLVVNRQGSIVVDNQECIQAVGMLARDPNFNINPVAKEWRKYAVL